MSHRPGPWVFLAHTLERVGPPVYLLHYLRWLAEHDPRPVEVVSLADGPLRTEFEQVARVHLLPHADLSHLGDAALVHVNTAVSIAALAYLPPGTGPVVAHVHELETGLDAHLPRADHHRLLTNTRHWIAASQAVAANLTERHGVAADHIVVHHEMIETAAIGADVDPTIRAGLGIPPDAPVVGTAGVVMWRKAPDLFLEVTTRTERPPGGDPPGHPVHFVWLGGADGAADTERFRSDIAAAGVADRVHLVPAVDDPFPWLAMFDVFVLTAREDAFPLACLEAAAAARPIVCFDSGGMPEFVGQECGAVIPFPDVVAMAASVTDLLTAPERAHALGAAGRDRVRARHDVAVAAPLLHQDLLRWAGS